MNQNQIKVLASAIVTGAYGVAIIVGALVEYRQEKVQKKYDVKFEEIIKNF